MKKLKVILVGAGNIMQSRHVPALATAPDKFEISGVIDRSSERAESLANRCGVSSYAAASAEEFRKFEWFSAADAVIAATPPSDHAEVIRECLNEGKHVLMEKPFVTDLSEGEKLTSLASEKNLVLAVNHNFQFSRSFLKLGRLIESGKLGKVRSFYCIQFSNDTRRLPSWGDDLPLGLFYDESPHAFYLLRRFGKGEIEIKDVSCRKSLNKKNTPQILDINLEVNGTPGTVYSNFESPICEWYFIVFGEKNYAMVDLFRDIITVLPDDGQHLMKEVFTSSFLATFHHWRGFISNGFRYVRHRLHYGMDVTHDNFYRAVVHGDNAALHNMNGVDGLAVNRAQHEVARAVR